MAGLTREPSYHCLSFLCISGSGAQRARRAWLSEVLEPIRRSWTSVIWRKMSCVSVSGVGDGAFSGLVLVPLILALGVVLSPERI